LRALWKHSLDVALTLFDEKNCFRRPGSRAINRALFDLIMDLAADIDVVNADEHKEKFAEEFGKLLADEEFQDYISRSVDHKSRTEKRFSIWKEHMDRVFK
jgi:hypothetical protein